ncbi:S24 family peptidase [Candidatus Thioglobus sp.]|jgi:SOS-response transcriptional repressor LexA|nr:S24 family peptidase [Candidatus Thioglobus sp.]
MSELEDSKTLFQSTCSTNSEPYALQNIGDMMSPEFSDNCIIIVDPSMPIHHKAFVIVDFEEDLYFRQYIEEDNKKILRCLNTEYEDIELNNIFVVRGCIVQQKQRKQKSLHYYLPNKISGKLEFNINGKEKSLNS